MRLYDCCREYWATNNLRRTIRSALARWKRRTTRGRRNSGGGKFRTCFCRAITPKSPNGEKNKRSNERGTIVLIFCAINLGRASVLGCSAEGRALSNLAGSRG